MVLKYTAFFSFIFALLLFFLPILLPNLSNFYNSLFGVLTQLSSGIFLLSYGYILKHYEERYKQILSEKERKLFFSNISFLSEELNKKIFKACSIIAIIIGSLFLLRVIFIIVVGIIIVLYSLS